MYRQQLIDRYLADLSQYQALYGDSDHSWHYEPRTTTLLLQHDTTTLNAFPLLAVTVRYHYDAHRPDAPHSIWWQSVSDSLLARQSSTVPRGYLVHYRDKSRTDELIEAIRRIQQLLRY